MWLEKCSCVGRALILEIDPMPNICEQFESDIGEILPEYKWTQILDEIE